MKTRVIILAVLAALGVAAPAGADHPLEEQRESLSLPFEGESKRIFDARIAAAPPMEGVGRNMELVANVALGKGEVPGGADDHDQFQNNAADIEAAGDHLYVGSYTQGLVIVNIASCADPQKPELCKPFVEGVLPCSGGQFDIQLSPDARIAVMAHESASANKDCRPGEEGAQIIDVSNKKSPREIAFISDKGTGIVEDGAHNTTLDWPYLYIDQYQPTYGQPPTEDTGKAEIFDLSNPAAPRLVSSIDFAGPNGETGFHDSYPDHRPDGKHLLYGASIQKSDIVDIADPSQPKELQTILDPQVGISHGAEPNHKRDVLIVTDEYGGGTGVGACGGTFDGNDPVGGPPPVAGYNPAPNGVGAVHFYKLNPATGLVPEPAAANKHSIFNIDYQANTPDQIAAEAGCTSHVFWQAPDQNRMTIAWYGRGTRIVDFNDPSRPREIANFIPKGADTWSAKAHCGFIYTGDMVRGVDVLRYTGERGAGWPATSGRADPQRAQTQLGGGSGDTRLCPRQAPVCTPPGLAARGKNLGRTKLGQKRTTVRTAYASRGAYRRNIDRYKLCGGGNMRVGYPSAKMLRKMKTGQRRRFRGRAILVLSSSRRTTVSGVKPGQSKAAMWKRIGRRRGLKVGGNVWYARRTKAATHLFKVRRNKVMEAGIANRGLSSSRAKLKRLLAGVR